VFIELHMIQSFGPSNLNRDDTGSPKDCEFGGVRRARISSQCLKFSIRKSPAFQASTGVEESVRTRYLTRALSEGLAAAGKPEAEVKRVAQAIAAGYTSKKNEMDKDDPERTKIAVYLSRNDIEWIKSELSARWDDLVSCLDLESAEGKGKKGKSGASSSAVQALVKDMIRRTAKRAGAPDIAMFGRMLADYPDTNVDAACQVAHAISTHRVTMEMDFFSAVDHLQRKEETGAAMMGFTSFDSACFYRYARIDWDQLLTNLSEERDLAKRTVEGFLRAATEAVPSGKQTNFAANNPPSFLFAVARRDGMGWSLANAFERPVRVHREGGLVAPSVQALDSYWGRLCALYGTDPLICTAVLALDSDLPLVYLKDAQCRSLGEWVKAITDALPAAKGGHERTLVATGGADAVLGSSEPLSRAGYWPGALQERGDRPLLRCTGTIPGVPHRRPGRVAPGRPR